MSYFEELKETNSIFKKILILLKPLGVITGGGSNRLSVDVNAVSSLPTVGTVTTVTTVTTTSTVGSLTNQVNNGGVNSFVLMKDQSRANFAQSVRTRLTF